MYISIVWFHEDTVSIKTRNFINNFYQKVLNFHTCTINKVQVLILKIFQLFHCHLVLDFFFLYTFTIFNTCLLRFKYFRLLLLASADLPSTASSVLILNPFLLNTPPYSLNKTHCSQSKPNCWWEKNVNI